MTNGITMTNAIIESIVSRSTTKYYDPAVTLSDDQNGDDDRGRSQHKKIDPCRSVFPGGGNE